MHRYASLNKQGKSESSELKREIQALLLEIVKRRDGGCILRDWIRPGYPVCGGFTKAGKLVLQADHLVTRSNSATYADSRLVVCVCKAHHAWKSLGNNLRKAEYDALVKTLISPERVALWERAEMDSWRPTRKVAYDWRLEIINLRQELKSYG